MDNGPARKNQIAQKLQQLGDEIGDPFEISTVRREVRFYFIIIIKILWQFIRVGLRFHQW